MLAQAVEGCIQGGVIEADKIAEQMQLPAAEIGRDLDPRDHIDAGADRGAPGGEDAGQGVVVGDGNRRQAGPGRQLDDLGRRVGAIAVRRVDVQVGTATGGPVHGLAEGSEGLACRHECAVNSEE